MYSNVQVEPQFQEPFKEKFEAQTKNECDDTSLEISARGFWCFGQRVLFDLRALFSLMALKYRNMNLSNAIASTKMRRKSNITKASYKQNRQYSPHS